MKLSPPHYLTTRDMAETACVLVCFFSSMVPVHFCRFIQRLTTECLLYVRLFEVLGIQSCA